MVVKKLHIAVKKLQKHCLSARQQLLDYVEKADCPESRALGTFLYPLVFLSNGLKITLSIIPIAMGTPRVENTHG
jgi:hypothetical protein